MKTLTGYLREVPDWGYYIDCMDGGKVVVDVSAVTVPLSTLNVPLAVSVDDDNKVLPTDGLPWYSKLEKQ